MTPEASDMQKFNNFKFFMRFTRFECLLIENTLSQIWDKTRTRTTPVHWILLQAPLWQNRDNKTKISSLEKEKESKFQYSLISTMYSNAYIFVNTYIYINLFVQMHCTIVIMYNMSPKGESRLSKMSRRVSKGHSNIEDIYFIVITCYDDPKRQQLHGMNSLRKRIPPIWSFQQCP